MLIESCLCVADIKLMYRPYVCMYVWPCACPKYVVAIVIFGHQLKSALNQRWPISSGKVWPSGMKKMNL